MKSKGYAVSLKEQQKLVTKWSPLALRPRSRLEVQNLFMEPSTAFAPCKNQQICTAVFGPKRSSASAPRQQF
jgi:hypothetical protein